MERPFSDILFWGAVAATVIAQIFILRSTARGMRTAVVQKPGRMALEWMWAILPAISLAMLFVWTWRTMHPSVPSTPTADVAFVAGAGPQS